jgi:hypothetical protein
MNASARPLSFWRGIFYLPLAIGLGGGMPIHGLGAVTHLTDDFPGDCGSLDLLAARPGRRRLHLTAAVTSSTSSFQPIAPGGAHAFLVICW